MQGHNSPPTVVAADDGGADAVGGGRDQFEADRGSLIAADVGQAALGIAAGEGAGATPAFDPEAGQRHGIAGAVVAGLDIVGETAGRAIVVGGRSRDRVGGGRNQGEADRGSLVALDVGQRALGVAARAGARPGPVLDLEAGVGDGGAGAAPPALTVPGVQLTLPLPPATLAVIA